MHFWFRCYRPPKRFPYRAAPDFRHPGLVDRCGEDACRCFALANKGYDLRLMQDFLGDRDPRHTVHYTRTAGRRFKGLWR